MRGVACAAPRSISLISPRLWVIEWGSADRLSGVLRRNVRAVEFRRDRGCPLLYPPPCFGRPSPRCEAGGGCGAGGGGVDEEGGGGVGESPPPHAASAAAASVPTAARNRPDCAAGRAGSTDASVMGSGPSPPCEGWALLAFTSVGLAAGGRRSASSIRFSSNSNARCAASRQPAPGRRDYSDSCPRSGCRILASSATAERSS